MFTIVPTAAQTAALCGPKSIESVLAADFLGNQKYINDWIHDWLCRNDYDPKNLPMCISESLLCDKSLMRALEEKGKAAVLSDDDEWLHSHCIVSVNLWPVVDFNVINNNTFDVLWSICPAPLDYSYCILESRRMHMWRPFVDLYGPDDTIRDVVQSFWSKGVEYCLSQGPDLTKNDVVKLCVRCPNVFKMVTDCNPPATQTAYDEYQLQKMLGRVPNIPLVEQWFWIHGFK